METKKYLKPTVFDSQYGSRQVLDLLAEKWTALVLYALAYGVKRHGELNREIKCKRQEESGSSQDLGNTVCLLS